MKQRTLGTALLVLAIILVGIVAYWNNRKHEEAIVFNQRSILAATWYRYKNTYLEANTLRTVDKQRNGITTSEGQSYTMLRAVWSDDKETFDRSWTWTKDNLGRSNDHLFAWLFGRRPDGTYGVLTEQGGQNTASDADTDIAVALLFAANRWSSPEYRAEAALIINDIWEKEVVIIGGRPYLAANNLEKTSTGDSIIVNPSYFAPYAYRMFAQVDPKHPWLQLVDSSYAMLERAIELPLDRTRSASLPPNWITIDKRTGSIKPSPAKALPTDYGYDALRVPWRMALDWQWYGDGRAKDILSRLELLETEWRTRKTLAAVYAHDGTPLTDQQSPAHYGASLGYFTVENPKIARAIYEQKILSLYSTDYQAWKEPLSYYDDNWTWFGLALYADQLPNLFAITSR